MKHLNQLYITSDWLTWGATCSFGYVPFLMYRTWILRLPYITCFPTQVNTVPPWGSFFLYLLYWKPKASAWRTIQDRIWVLPDKIPMFNKIDRLNALMLQVWQVFLQTCQMTISRRSKEGPETNSMMLVLNFFHLSIECPVPPEWHEIHLLLRDNDKLLMASSRFTAKVSSSLDN